MSRARSARGTYLSGYDVKTVVSCRDSRVAGVAAFGAGHRRLERGGRQAPDMAPTTPSGSGRTANRHFEVQNTTW